MPASYIEVIGCHHQIVQCLHDIDSVLIVHNVRLNMIPHVALENSDATVCEHACIYSVLDGVVQWTIDLADDATEHI